MSYPPPNPKYVGPVKFHGRATNKPIKRLVVHGTTGANSCRDGYAELIANYFRSGVTRPSSAHYVVDPSVVLQMVYDSVVAYHAPPNGNSIGVELCDPVVGKLARWKDAEHTAMLKRAATLFAELCLAYNVPIRKVGYLGLRAGRRGICGHVDVGKAWGQTSHWDPGAFPWSRFIGMVKAEAARLKAAAANRPAPAPKPQSRVSKARDLLRAALRATTNPRRRARINAGLNELPEE